MGSSSSISSTSSSKAKDPDCYLRNRMMRQQCLGTRPDNGYTVPKPYFDNNNNISGTPTPTQNQYQQPMTYTGKNQIGCDCQGNVVECDENGRIIRVIKPNNR